MSTRPEQYRFNPLDAALILTLAARFYKTDQAVRKAAKRVHHQADRRTRALMKVVTRAPYPLEIIERL